VFATGKKERGALKSITWRRFTHDFQLRRLIFAFCVLKRTQAPGHRLIGAYLDGEQGE